MLGPLSPYIPWLFSGLFILVWKLGRPLFRRPPGPRPWPIIGNAFDLPTTNSWLTYNAWSKTYDSEVISLNALGKCVVVLNSFKAATDLLEKKSQIYSGRPCGIMAPLLGFEFSLVVMPYARFWRAHRRMLNQHFQVSVLRKYSILKTNQIRRCLANILRSPNMVRGHVRQMVTSTIVSFMYGKEVVTIEDDYVRWAERSLTAITQTLVPGAFPVEIVPFLQYMPRWFPGTNHHELVDEYRGDMLNFCEAPYKATETAFNNGRSGRDSSILAAILENIRDGISQPGEKAELRKIAKNVAANAYGAAVDTTNSYCLSFLLAIALFPEVQKKAQAELDKTIGPGRLPELEDLDKLVYVRALVMETLRWIPVLPLGIPHALDADDVYGGYHLPKGAIVIANQWAILHNPQDYPNPEIFNPDRFIGKDGEIDHSVLDPAHVAFGFGRRICPGRYFGLNSLSIFVASVLHVFDVDAGSDKNGPIHLHDETIGDASIYPVVVPCKFTLRSEGSAQLLSGF